MKKIFKLLFLAMALISLLSVATFADWVQEGDNWKYKQGDDFIYDNFKKDGDAYYYFNSDGNMVTGVVEIENDKYIFGSDGKAKTDGVKIFGKEYKTTLKGKIIDKDGDLDIYTPDECEVDIVHSTARDALNAEKQAFRKADAALQYSLSAVKDGETEGWNLVGSNYRFVKDKQKKAHCYDRFYFAKQGYSTIYFDDLGNAKPLTWIKLADGRLQLVLEQGQAEYTGGDIAIKGRPLLYNFSDRTISKADSDKVFEGGFNLDTYKAELLLDFQAMYVKKLEDNNQTEQNKIKAQQEAIEYANRLKLSSSTGVVKTFQTEGDDGSTIKGKINIRVPIFTGTNSDKVNKAILAHYENTVVKIVQAAAAERGASCPKEIGIGDPSIFVEGDILTIRINSTVTGQCDIKYNIATNAWDIR